MPDLDPDKFFKGKAGGTVGKSMIELLPSSRRVAIAGFRVAFVASPAGAMPFETVKVSARCRRWELNFRAEVRVRTDMRAITLR